MTSLGQFVNEWSIRKILRSSRYVVYTVLFFLSSSSSSFLFLESLWFSFLFSLGAGLGSIKYNTKAVPCSDLVLFSLISGAVADELVVSSAFVKPIFWIACCLIQIIIRVWFLLTNTFLLPAYRLFRNCWALFLWWAMTIILLRK